MNLIILVFFIFPIIVFVASILVYKLVMKWYVAPLLTFVLFAILTFTIFNETFFYWVVVYTILSAMISLVMKKFIRK